MRIFKRKTSPYWWATWTDTNGKRHRKSTRTDDQELAQALAAKWQQERFLEKHFGVIPDYPFRDALFRYGQEKQRENPEGYASNVKYRLQHFLDRFDCMMVADFNLAILQDYLEERLDEVAETTAYRELAVLKAILNKAHREERLASVPPFPKMRKSPGRCRWLTVDEEKRLLAHAKSHLRPIILFALDTGGRRSEILKLDWRNVDLSRGLVTFVKTKNGEDRTIRLTDRARKVLEGQGPKETGPVFTFGGKAIKDVKKSFDNARMKAGIEDFRFHDLRHTFASRLVQKGIPLYEVMNLTGHKSLEMVQRYSHLAPDYQERAIAALNSFGESDGTNLAQLPKMETVRFA